MFKQEATKEGWPVIRCVNCCVGVNAVVLYGCGDQIYMDFIRFLICEVLYA